MKPKSDNVSKVDLSLPSEADNNQLRTLELNPKSTLGEVEIDPKQLRSAPVVLGRQESAFHTTGKGE